MKNSSILKNEVINSYPFSGVKYSTVREIGNRVRISPNGNSFDILYIEPSFNQEFGFECKREVIINDNFTKNLLSYFYFLNGMCRVYNNDYIYRHDGFPNTNIFIDIVLMNINEFLSCCRDSDFNVGDISYIFAKQFFKNEFNQLYDNECDYLFLNDLFEFLKNDKFTVSYNSSTQFYDVIDEGNLNGFVDIIINNKDNILNAEQLIMNKNFSSSVTSFIPGCSFVKKMKSNVI